MSNLYHKALLLAKQVHANQVDKGGRPYINHPIKVSKMVQSPTAKIVALLHDVCEDGDVTSDELRAYGFNDNIVKAVDTLTRRSDESYEAYIKRIKGNKLALEVKIADLKHNSDITRIPKPTEKDILRVEKYKRILKELQNENK